VWASETELSTVDFVRDDAMVERGADGLIQPESGWCCPKKYNDASTARGPTQFSSVSPEALAKTNPALLTKRSPPLPADLVDSFKRVGALSS
jgi:hypothetical protein